MSLASINRSKWLTRAILLSALALQGCEGHRGMKSLKSASVTTHILTRDIYFGAGNRLPETEAQALREYLAGLGVGFSDRLWLEDPETVGAKERRAAIARIVAEAGVLLSTSSLASTDNPPAGGTVRLRIERAEAIPPKCPDWSGPSGQNMTGSTHSNYGCATATNLAAMIADPRDLADGRDYKGTGSAEAAKSHDYWLRRIPTGYIREVSGGNGTSGGGSGGGGGNGK